MKALHLLGVLVLSAASLNAATVFINFDDLPGGLAPVPTNYQGLTWDSGWNYWTGTPGAFVPTSTPNLAYFNSANDQGFSFAAPVTFLGGFFEGAAGSSTVHFDLFLGGILQASSSDLLVNSANGIFLSSGYAGLVDRVQIHITGALSGWTVDDLSYDTVVPEPTSLALTGIGLSGLYFFRRRRSS